MVALAANDWMSLIDARCVDQDPGGYASQTDLKPRVVVSPSAAVSKKSPRVPKVPQGHVTRYRLKVPAHAGTGTAPPLSLLRVHIQQQRENRSKGWQAKRGQIPKSYGDVQDQA
jgi:hypothetical protein